MSEPKGQNEAACGGSALTAELERITPAMKADCIGEFSFEIEETCSACDFHGADDECEVCGGEIHYQRTVTVPWTVCKEIYKRMVRSNA